MGVGEHVCMKSQEYNFVCHSSGIVHFSFKTGSLTGQELASTVAMA